MSSNCWVIEERITFLFCFVKEAQQCEAGRKGQGGRNGREKDRGPSPPRSSRSMGQRHTETRVYVKLGYSFLWLAQGIRSHHSSYYLAVVYIMKAIFLGVFSLTVTFAFQSFFIHSAFFLTEGITFGYICFCRRTTASVWLFKNP